MVLQACEEVCEPGERLGVVELGRLDQRVDGGGAAAAFVGTGEGPVAPAGGDRAHRRLGGIVAHAQAAIVEEADERVPGVEAVGDDLCSLAVGRDPGVLLAQPDAQGVDQRLAAILANVAAFCGLKAIDLALDGEQGVDAGNGLDAGRRLVEAGQIEEVAPRVGPACVRLSPGKEDGCDLKPFIVIQRVRRPPGRGGARQPEASLAWAAATALVKRRQQVLKPCGSLEIM